MSYSVQIANIYELLSEDDAPQAKGQAKDTKSAPAKAPAKQTQAPQKSQQPKDTQKQTRPPRQDRPPRQQGEISTGTPKESHERQGGNRERRERGASSFQSGSKRVYDRKPGSGRGRENNKKGGGGRANWGKEGEEPTPEVEGKEKTEEKKEEKTEEKTEENVTEKKEEVVEEEEDKTITFEEYLKNKESVQFKLPEARKPNEGVDNKELKKWQGYAVLKRDEEEEKETSTESSEKKEKKPKKIVVPLDEIFDVKTPPISSPRGRGRGRGRGGSTRGGSGRGGSTGRGGNAPRGGNRGGRGGARGGQGSAEIKMDESSFPSLAPTKA